MNDRKLHIISFDIPVPVNYGGAIDVFYKLKSLSSIGIGIILHCFEYDRKPAPILNELCEKVFYYRRDISKTKLFSRKPYIVVTRDSAELLNNLTSDKHPILFEGLHTCLFLNDKKLRDRVKIVRTHNIEHEYYNNLARVEKDLFKRYYFLNESAKLNKFETILEHATGIASISKNDSLHFSRRNKNVCTISAFHPHESITAEAGKGNFALYHGSLDVGENNEAALFLVNKVFNDLDIPLLIAGNKPSKELKKAIEGRSNISLKYGITSDDIYQLISSAHVNILPTFQSTGIKLKLLAALFRGRFCLVNTPMVEKTGLEKLCIIHDDADDMKKELIRLFGISYSPEENQLREEILLRNGFSNHSNVQQLISMLYK
jgi:hypothetical protein